MASDHGREDRELDMFKELVTVLFKTAASIGLGIILVKAKAIEPAKGDMKAMSFFCGRIAMPLLYFRVVATAKYSDIDLGVIASCNVPKAILALCTLAVVYFGYKRGHTTPKRFIVAVIFGFSTTAGNDFAVGFPVIQAVYPSSVLEKGENLVAQLAINTAIHILVFVPWTLGALCIARHMETGQGEGIMKTVLRVLQATIENPLMIMLILGLTVNLVAGPYMTEGKQGTLELPKMLDQLVDHVTRPFGTLALFITGTIASKPNFRIWAVVLVFLKVFGCSFIGFYFARNLLCHKAADGHRWGSDMLCREDRQTFQEFIFLYGCIPASTVPVVFARDFAPEIAELLSQSIVLGLLAAAGNTFLSTFIFTSSSLSPLQVICSTQGVLTSFSLWCSVLLVVIIAVSWRWWRRMPVDILALYVLSTLAHAGFTLQLSHNNSWCAGMFDHTKADCTSPVGARMHVFEFVFRYFRETNYLLVILLYLHFVSISPPSERGHRYFRLAALVVPAIWATVNPEGHVGCWSRRDYYIDFGRVASRLVVLVVLCVVHFRGGWNAREVSLMAERLQARAVRRITQFGGVIDVINRPSQGGANLPPAEGAPASQRPEGQPLTQDAGPVAVEVTMVMEEGEAAAAPATVAASPSSQSAPAPAATVVDSEAGHGTQFLNVPGSRPASGPRRNTTDGAATQSTMPVGEQPSPQVYRIATGTSDPRSRASSTQGSVARSQRTGHATTTQEASDDRSRASTMQVFWSMDDVLPDGRRRNSLKDVPRVARLSMAPSVPILPKTTMRFLALTLAIRTATEVLLYMTPMTSKEHNGPLVVMVIIYMALEYGQGLIVLVLLLTDDAFQTLIASVIQMLRQKDIPLYPGPVPEHLARIRVPDHLKATRSRRCQSYDNCFVGHDFVTHLVSSGFADDREEAVVLGRELLRYGRIMHVERQRDFHDEMFFYLEVEPGGETEPIRVESETGPPPPSPPATRARFASPLAGPAVPAPPTEEGAGPPAPAAGRNDQRRASPPAEVEMGTLRRTSHKTPLRFRMYSDTDCLDALEPEEEAW